MRAPLVDAKSGPPPEAFEATWTTRDAHPPLHVLRAGVTLGSIAARVDGVIRRDVDGWRLTVLQDRSEPTRQRDAPADLVRGRWPFREIEGHPRRLGDICLRQDGILVTLRDARPSPRPALPETRDGRAPRMDSGIVGPSLWNRRTGHESGRHGRTGSWCVSRSRRSLGADQGSPGTGCGRGGSLDRDGVHPSQGHARGPGGRCAASAIARRFELRRKLLTLRENQGTSIALGLAAAPLVPVPLLDRSGLPMAIDASALPAAKLLQGSVRERPASG